MWAQPHHLSTQPSQLIRTDTRACAHKLEGTHSCATHFLVVEPPARLRHALCIPEERRAREIGYARDVAFPEAIVAAALIEAYVDDAEIPHDVHVALGEHHRVNELEWHPEQEEPQEGARLTHGASPI